MHLKMLSAMKKKTTTTQNNKSERVCEGFWGGKVSFKLKIQWSK